MREQFSPEQPQISMEEYRRDFFEKMRKDTRVLSDNEYQKLFVPAKLAWGINSPAFILPKSYFNRHPHPETIPNDVEGDLIAINGESVSDPDFIKYLIAHEHWEKYIGSKKGFSLEKENKADFRLPILERKRPAHRYATLKEFHAAEEDGKLDQYMQWWREFYQTDIELIQTMPEGEIEKISKNYGKNGKDRNAIIQFIQKNLKIKEDIYSTLVAKR